MERLRDVLRLKDLLGVSLDELRELASAAGARASLRKEWDRGIEDPVRRREVLFEALGHVERQLELAQRRRAEVTGLERELRAKHDRLRRTGSASSIGRTWSWASRKRCRPDEP